MRGKVMMPDASAPESHAIIERICPLSGPVQEAIANKRGEFVWRPGQGIVDGLGIFVNRSPIVCHLRARTPGYESNLLSLSDPEVFRTSQLPTMVLHPSAASPPAAQLKIAQPP